MTIKKMLGREAVKVLAARAVRPRNWFQVHASAGHVDRVFVDGSNALDHARRTGGYIWTMGAPVAVPA